MLRSEKEILMNTKYRKSRNLLWILYLLLSALLFFLSARVPGFPMMLGTLPILAFFPVVIYSCVLTHRARIADDQEILKEIQRRNLTLSSVNSFLTDKSRKGKEIGWAEDVLIGIIGIPSLAFVAVALFGFDDAPLAVTVTYTLEALLIGYFCVYMLINRKMQRKKAVQYAILFASADKGEFSFAELSAAAGSGRAAEEVTRLLRRNYLTNIQAEPQNNCVKIIGYRKLPRNAYVCANCGAASSITVGEAKICRYCGRPFHT